MSLLVGSLSRVELDQLARDIVHFETLAARAAELRRWSDMLFLQQQRELACDRRYEVLRQYLARLQYAQGHARLWWR